MSVESTDRGDERLSWLAGARQQSQALAELRAAHPVPFGWGAGESRRRAGGRPLWLTAALTAGVLGLATVTLAMLHVRRTAPPRPTPSTVQPLGAAGQRPVATPRRPPARRALLPAEQPPDQPAPAPRRRAKPQVRRAEPPKAAAAAAAAGDSSGEVTFDGDEAGSMIIVTPPPGKRVPLWTPEEYKKQHAGHQHWHGERL